MCFWVRVFLEPSPRVLADKDVALRVTQRNATDPGRVDARDCVNEPSKTLLEFNLKPKEPDIGSGRRQRPDSVEGGKRKSTLGLDLKWILYQGTTGSGQLAAFLYFC